MIKSLLFFLVTGCSTVQSIPDADIKKGPPPGKEWCIVPKEGGGVRAVPMSCDEYVKMTKGNK